MGVCAAERPTRQLMRAVLPGDGPVYIFFLRDWICYQERFKGKVQVRCIKVTCRILPFTCGTLNPSSIWPFWKQLVLISSTTGPTLCLISGACTSEGKSMIKLWFNSFQAFTTLHLIWFLLQPLYIYRERERELQGTPLLLVQLQGEGWGDGGILFKWWLDLCSCFI